MDDHQPHLRVEVRPIEDWDEPHLLRAYDLTTWNVTRLLGLSEDHPNRDYEIGVSRASAERYGMELLRRGLL